jgi:hypothetical protein
MIKLKPYYKPRSSILKQTQKLKKTYTDVDQLFRLIIANSFFVFSCFRISMM